MAVKDSIGGWKDNAFVHKATKGCSTFKYFLGKWYSTYTNGFNQKNLECPYPEVFI